VVSTLLVFQGVATQAAAAPESDRATCIAAAERGQKLRKDGRLPEAQKDFLACARSECPAFVRGDCAQWLSDVVAVMPSIVVAARMGGKDLFDVRVIIDGAVVLERLDGKGIPMSTGEHVLRFEYATEPPVETKVLMREGDKGRAIDVTFSGSGKPATIGGPTIAPPPPTPNPPPTTGKGHSVVPWIVAGVGAATAVTGAVLFVVGNGNFPAECNKDTGTCARGIDEAETADRVDRASSSHGESNLGLGLLIGGGVVAIGGVVWHFLEGSQTNGGAEKPKDAATAAGASRWHLVPNVSSHNSSLTLTGQF